MKPPDWDRIEEIYHETLAVPRSERSAFVAKACDNDPVCMHEVNALLEADASLDGFLETPIVKLHPSSVDIVVGTRIAERYVIKSELGNGGMSQVYLADDVKMEQQAVIKVLSRELLKNPYARQKFKQEVEALKRIRHDSVVRVFDKGELVDGRPYIAMEHVDGETLLSHIPPEGMDLERSAAILKQMGRALEHVHQKNIFHRDLKPANIILRHDTDSVVLVDFGIAKVKHSAIASSTVNGTAFGTLGYVSPEQLRGEKITAASDIYSMAVVAYQMVTGRLPFDPTSPADLLDIQRAGVKLKPVALRRNLPHPAQDIILRGLTFKPKARYENAREFGDSLAQALLGPREVDKDTEWLKVLMIVAGVALLAFGIYWFLIRKPPEFNRSFKYFLTIQPMRDGQPYQEPFQSHGEDEIFGSGDNFRLSLLSPVPAYFYVFKEEPPESPDTSFRMIFPSAATNNGSATLGANQTIEPEWFTFRGPPGDENFWMVWSVTPVPQLESAKTEAFKHPKGGLTGRTLVLVKEFLRVKQTETKVTVYNYKASKTAIARGPGDLLVTLVQFKHR